MNDVFSSDLVKEFTKNKTALAGIGILLALVMISLIAAVTVPIDTFKQWNNPSNWISYPKTSMPIWVNYFVTDKIPEHVIIENPSIISKEGEISVISHQFEIEFLSDDFPNGFIYEFTAEYSGSPLLQIHVIRPDQAKILLLSTSLPNSDTEIIHSERIFSTDEIIRKNIQIQSVNLEFYRDGIPNEDLIFADNNKKILKGNICFW